jgi:hypothetical protein
MMLLALFSLVPLASGCGTAKSVYKGVYKKVTGVVVRSESSELRKRVLILPVLDQQGVGDRADALTEQLATYLERDPNLAVYRQKEPLPSTVKVRSPKFGIIIDPDLAQKAEEMGMNVLITCVLNRYEVIDHGPGLWPVNQIPVWPFTRKDTEVEISMVINALDITNGTLFLTNLERVRMEVPPDKEEEESLIVKEKGLRSDQELISAVPDNVKEEALSKILENQAEAITEKLREKKWAGRVLSANSDKVMINAGRDVGLSEGSVFEVFNRGDSIRSVSGRSLYLLGNKVGEIRTVRVLDKYSSAVPLNGERFMAGQVIREKE